MSKFSIKGTGDDARAALQAQFDARNAAFEADLHALMRSPPQPTVTEQPVKPPAVTQWALGSDRDRRHR